VTTHRHSFSELVREQDRIAGKLDRDRDREHYAPREHHRRTFDEEIEHLRSKIANTTDRERCEQLSVTLAKMQDASERPDADVGKRTTPSFWRAED
jgi:hypothetical protein